MDGTCPYFWFQMGLLVVLFYIAIYSNVLPFDTLWLERNFAPWRLRQGFRMLRLWIPVIWNNVDWDIYPMLEMMKHHMELYDKHVQGCWVHDREDETDQLALRRALVCLKEFHDPDIICPKPEGARVWWEEKRNKEGRVYAYKFCSTQEFKDWCEQRRRIEERAWNEFWDIMKKHSRNWWC